MELIETRIRQHYASENGEWLVEKGKVKEAKLLKEACIEIERLRRGLSTSEASYYRAIMAYSEKNREMEAREKLLTNREQKFAERIDSFVKGLGYLK